VYFDTYAKGKPPASLGNSAMLIAKKAAIKESGSYVTDVSIFVIL
jgi:hypothetical protein